MGIPTIEVGILSSKAIHFKLKGLFRCPVAGDLSGQEGSVAAGVVSFAIE
jgi:hypothetical protein